MQHSCFRKKLSTLFSVALVILTVWPAGAGETSAVRLKIEQPMTPPAWALAERALLKAYGEAAEEFAAKYLDDRGWLRCVERWGGNDGPDDAMESFNQWTLVYSLGGPEPLLRLYRKAWEGHLDQFSHAKAPSVPAAKDGMFYKEFITSFDWEHTGEGLAAFHFYALVAPGDQQYVERVRRFAGFYMNEDPEAPNYDPVHKIIRSLHNGSRGPKLTDASPVEWGGEPVAGRPERLSRYEHAGNIRGDHPLNLAACTLAFHAYALTGEQKYREWLLEYAAAWRDRILANGGNIPTNIGLDGKIGSEWGGKWYGGVFGWNFDPASPIRNYFMRGVRIGMGEAFLLTGDPRYPDVLRRQISNLYAARKEENGRILLPNKFGENGWYGYRPNQWFDVQRDLYLWSLNSADRKWLIEDPWLRFLDGENPDYPVRVFGEQFERIRSRLEAMRRDRSTPDTRPCDGAQPFNPVSADGLVSLMLGANHPGTSGNILHSQLKYFDPERRRAGIPEDVAALVEAIDSGGVKVMLVNTNPVRGRRVVVQAGAYAEHEFISVEAAGQRLPLNAASFTVELAPGSGAKLLVSMKRYVRQPTAALPWDR